MPCWKQYTMLLLGSILVGVCNVASITWMATMEPLQANIVLISWAIGWPSSFIFHRLTRMFTRYLRKRRMLERGKKVQGALRKNPSMYVADGRPNTVAMQHMSAAGGLVANWDYRSTDKKPSKRHGRVTGMLSKRSSGSVPTRTAGKHGRSETTDLGAKSRKSRASAPSPSDDLPLNSVRV